MNHPRYHVGAQCDTIEEQIEDVVGERAHQVRNHIGRIRALLRTSEQELHELDVKDEYDEDVEKEEPIYFTTWEDVDLSHHLVRSIVPTDTGVKIKTGQDGPRTDVRGLDFKSFVPRPPPVNQTQVTS